MIAKQMKCACGNVINLICVNGSLIADLVMVECSKCGNIISSPVVDVPDCSKCKKN